MNRRYFIAGNWKMNKSVTEAEELLGALLEQIGSPEPVDVACCVPFPVLETCARLIGDSTVLALGAQNLYPKDSGAYTGEVSAPMLTAFGAKYVILGHSERREYFAESDAFINEKVLAALNANLRPILCVGETLQQREANETMTVVFTQLSGGLADVPGDRASEVVIAYEPVWAIGTGKTATPEMAEEVHAAIRAQLSERFGSDAAATIRVLYGGSMKPANAEGLLAQPNIDGGLIGGASLKADDFLALVASAKAAPEL